MFYQFHIRPDRSGRAGYVEVMSSGPVTTSEAATKWFRSNRTLALGGALGLIVAVAAATSGASRFTGARWVPHWRSTAPAPVTRPALRAPPRKVPIPSVGRGPDLPVGTILLWVVIGLGAVAILYLAWRLITGRSSRPTRRRPDVSALSPSASASEPEPEAPIIRRGVEQALRLLNEEGTPGDAVMLAWLGLEQSAEDSGIVRKPAETPTEFTSRIMKRVFADDQAIAALLALYLRARFADYVVTARDVTRARDALEALVRSWDVDASSVPPGRLSGLRR
jgi:hypothetical protein